MSLAGLAEIARAFPLFGRFRGGAPYGSGHINDTYVITFDQAGNVVRYILQRVNRRIFGDVAALMENIGRVTCHLREKIDAGNGSDLSRRTLDLVPTREGKYHLCDATGDFWRCYLFIEAATTFDVITSPRQAAEAAKAFGEFQRMVADLPGGRLHETIPDFHHTRRRFTAFQRALDADALDRAASVREEIAFAMAREPMVDVLLGLQADGKIPERITHNDTKLNNVMLDDATGVGVCVIDLDTVMPGLALYDFGDMVRSATNSGAEDERDTSLVNARPEIFEALVEGYLASAGSFLNATEVAHLVFAGRLITFEIGLRFLTDFLSGDVYFKSKRPGHNLDRARNQFALLRSMERQQAAMEAIVNRYLIPPPRRSPRTARAASRAEKSSPRALITGGAGFIGSHLAAQLLARGIKVRIIDNFRTGNRRNLAGLDVDLIEGSILHESLVKRAMEGIDYVFHLAALVSVPESVGQPRSCVELNVIGLLNVLEAAAAVHAKKLCFASSAAIYGDNPAAPKNEVMRPEPRSPYAMTKLDGEYYCRQFAEAGLLETVALRYFNVFGPRQDPASAYAAAVPIFMRQALAGQPLTVYGDGGQTRDFVFVKDIAAANLFAATTPGVKGVYNVGYGGQITVLELAHRIIRLAGSRSEIRHAAERAGDVRHSRANVDALYLAGFRPESSLDAGLVETINFFRKQAGHSSLVSSEKS